MFFFFSFLLDAPCIIDSSLLWFFLLSIWESVFAFHVQKESDHNTINSRPSNSDKASMYTS